MPHRAAAVLPSTRHPVSLRALAILGYACHSTSAMLMEKMCCWLVWSTTQKRAVGSEKYPIGYWLLALALMIRAARVPTIQMIKEYFGVAVVSEPWMAQRRS